MIRLTCAALIVGSALSAPVSAQNLIHYGDVAGWEILVDPTLGNGCLIQSEFEDGSLVRIGLDANAGTGYITAFNESWGDIEANRTYPIVFDLDGVTYNGEAKGIWLDNMPGADIVFVNEDFMFDLAARNTLTLIHDGEPVMAIDLAGTGAGLDQVLACQEKQS